MVPSSWASSGIPSIWRTRGEPSCRTVPSAVKPGADPVFSGSAETSMVFGKPCSRRRVSSSTVKPLAAATAGALTTFTFSSSTAFSTPASTALRSRCVPTSATSPAYRMRIRAGLDAANALLHFRNVLGVDHLPRLRTYGRVERDEIAFGQKLIERHQFHGQLSCCRFADEWIKRNNAHIEGFCPGCHLAADATETNETQRFAAHLGARRRFFPAALAHGGIEFWKLPDKRQ